MVVSVRANASVSDVCDVNVSVRGACDVRASDGVRVNVRGVRVRRDVKSVDDGDRVCARVGVQAPSVCHAVKRVRVSSLPSTVVCVVWPLSRFFVVRTRCLVAASCDVNVKTYQRNNMAASKWKESTNVETTSSQILTDRK